MVRVIRVLLGATALAARKIEWGLSLAVLEVSITLHEAGYECRPSLEKMQKCIATMKEALATGQLHGGAAAKLSGRLLWAAQHSFRRLGRAMLRPIFRQKSSRRERQLLHLPVAAGACQCRSGRFGKDSDLQVALLWWCSILEREIVETRAWVAPKRSPVHLFVDARGEPPRYGHVASGSPPCCDKAARTGALRCCSLMDGSTLPMGGHRQG